MDASVVFDARSFDSRYWLKDAIDFAVKRDDNTADEQIEKLLPIFDWSWPSYLRKKLLPPELRKKDETRRMSREEVALCAMALSVRNPYDDMPADLPNGFVAYPFIGRIDDKNAAFLKVEREPLVRPRHPLYPDARPMAWVVGDDAMNISYVKGSSVYGVDFSDTKARLKDGDVVVVDLPQHSLLGDSSLIAMRMVELVGNTIELRPSSHTEHRSITINNSDLKDNSKIKILTLVYKGDVG